MKSSHLLEGAGEPTYRAARMAQRSFIWTAFFCALSASNVLFGCGGKGKAQPESPSAQVLPDDRRVTQAKGAEEEKELPGRDFVSLGTVPAGALGPRLTVTEKGHFIVWADVKGADPALYSEYVSPEGQASVPRRLASVGASARRLQVGEGAGGDRIASWIRHQGERDILEVTILGTQGQLVGGPYLVSETPSDIIFKQVVPTAQGALVFWVERRGTSADLYAAVLQGRGAERPKRLVREVSAWQLVKTRAGINLATREGAEHPEIRLRQLGDSGQVLGSPQTVARDVEGGLDLDLAVSKDRILVAYTEGAELDTQVVAASFDLAGNPLGARVPLTLPRPEQALVRLLSSGDSETISVVWEEPLLAVHGLPSFLLGHWTPAAPHVRPQVRFFASRKDPLLPLLESAEGQVFVVTDETRCEGSGDSGGVNCQELGRAGAVMDPQGMLQVSRSFVLPSGERPGMAWDLTCQAQSCFLLLAGRKSPAEVYLAPLQAGDNKSEAFVRDAKGPRATFIQTVMEVPELSGLDFSRSEGPGDRESVTWVSYFDHEKPYVSANQPAPDGRNAPVRARLQSLSIQSSSSAQGNPQRLRVDETVLSYRARSLGGVALAPPGESPGLVAWAAIDKNDPQLFATLVDREGRKVGQKMLTHVPGEVSDVTVTQTVGGFVLCWVDGRLDSPEVFSLKVDDKLAPVGPAHQVSHGARGPSDPALITVGDEVLVVWSDARGASGEGHADLYFAALDSKDAAPLGSERKLLTTEGHAHAPRLGHSKMEDGKSALLVAWIDSDPTDTAHAGSAFFALVSASGAVLRPAEALATPPHATDISLDCGAGGCRALLLLGPSSESSRSQLWGVQFSPAGAGPVGLLLPLSASSPGGVVPILKGDIVYYADEASSKEGWVLRRAQIDWEN